MQWSKKAGRGAGQTHLNSDAKIADEGCPQGAPLPDSGSLTWFCPNLMQLPWGGACRYSFSGKFLIFSLNHSCIRSNRFFLSVSISLMKRFASS